MAGKVDLSRLCQVVETSRTVMQFFREERMRAIRQLAGDRYSTTAAPKKTYVNFLSLYCKIVGRSLFAKNPRVSLSTFERSQKATVLAMENWCNQELDHMRYAETMQRIVMDALLAIGIAKVALANPIESATMAWNLQAAAPFISRVDLDDFVFDVHARDFNEVGFIGHRYRAPVSLIRDSDLYDSEAKKRLAPNDHDYNPEGDERVGMIGRDYGGYDDEYEDMVDLWEIYCPRYRTIYTVSEDDLGGMDNKRKIFKPLREQAWLGPETGPYHILAFEIIPGNPFPKGPAQDIMNLHDALNESYRKLIRQAARQKDMTAYEKNMAEDAETIRKTNDGDLLPLTNPKSVVPLSTGGINQGQFLMMKELFERASLMAGNLITMGGLAPQAGTLGQEQLLSTQSNGQISSMQDAVAAHVTETVKGLLWYWWHDPYKVMRTKFEDVNTPGIEITQQIHPAGAPADLARNGEMPKIKIDPYSIRYQTPQQRATAIIEILTKVFAPFAQPAAAQGVGLDFQATFAMLAKYMDQPDLQTLLTIQEPPQTDTATGASHEGTMPTETTRNYNRRSLGGDSAQAQDAEMETMMERGNTNGPMNGQLQQA